MTDTTKMASQLAGSRLGKSSALYMAAVNCVRQTQNQLQAGKLLAKKFMEVNPWAAELIGTAQIERQALAYVQKRYHEMHHGVGQSPRAPKGQISTAGSVVQSAKWTSTDISAAADPGRGGAGQVQNATNGQRLHASAASEPILHNTKKPTFNPTHMAEAQSRLKGILADSILQTLKFSDGKLVGVLSLREIRCYENDGTLAKVLLDKIRLKFRNPDTDKTITEYLNEHEIRICVETAQDVKLVQAQL